MKESLRRFLQDELLGHMLDRELDEREDLLESGLVDSLGMMRLVGFIQQELGVTVPPEDVTIETFGSLERISGYLESRTNEG